MDAPAPAPSQTEPSVDRALGEALRSRADQQQLELTRQPSAWQQAALDEGVRRRPAGR